MGDHSLLVDKSRTVQRFWIGSVPLSLRAHVSKREREKEREGERERERRGRELQRVLEKNGTDLDDRKCI